MAATPQYGSMVFRGLRSRRTYVKDIYISDVANANINFDDGNGASSTSESFWTPPEPVALVDFAMHTGTADTTAIRTTRNGIPTGDTLRYAPHLDSIATRPRLTIGFNTGTKIAAKQIA